MNDLVPQLSLMRGGVSSDVGGGTRPDRGPSLGSHADDELMLLARGGLREAYDTLVRRYQSQVMRVAARRLGRPGLAADVAQNAFLDLYRALPRYQARGCFPAYLYRTVLNRCRLAERAARAEGRFSLPFFGSTAEVALEVSAPTASAEAMVLAQERERDVQDAVARLSPKLRDVVSLRYGGELSYDEIAHTLQVPVGTVKRRLFDAMEKLRRTMEEL